MMPFRIQSSTGQGNLAADLFQPAASCAAPRFLCLIIHGMAEHRRRYEPFARWLASQGGIICTFDLPGHGETAPGPEQLGFFARQAGADQVLQDIDAIAEHLQRQAPGLPLFMFAHSMGSLISRDYCATYKRPLAGVIWSGTPGPNPLLGVGQAIAAVSRLFHGPMYRDPLLDKMLHQGHFSRISQPRTAFDWLTRDEAIVEAYVRDPWCGNPFTVAGMQDMMVWSKRVNQSAWASKLDRKLPVLIMGGADDPVSGYGQGPALVGQWLQQLQQPVQLKIYPNCRHEILNEVNRDDVYQDIWHWLDQRLDASGKLQSPTEG